ncbi:alpha-1,4-glucan--maltose-1-phosphate maltosyltransferase [Acidisoma cellulosilytica]|uniref:Alpha-1,4-glucan:maltose-1-phosphate maltosyltransferase n=1 Tax=Acidisoma cellulosilyticum TaxID=2802395 RepID=A0A963Z420_9PROT|nr:alpha-1,4-glucan--maltose-1-phosphate maltosyltransferase [Acidisoma cellulosilyticum]MCB8882373.1 alpha-1,4-glucan--maltose-1-phosphate maltosyltransferase [Acidisoma cellulosilyticum]
MTFQNKINAPSAERLASAPASARETPRIYLFHPLLAGPIGDWGKWFDHAAGLGFTHVLSAPFFAGPSLQLPSDFSRVFDGLGWDGTADEALAAYAKAARSAGLRPLLDIYPGFVAENAGAGLFTVPAADHARDPRHYAGFAGAASADWTNAAAELGDFWASHLAQWQQAGIAGFRVDLKQIAPAERLAFLRSIGGADTGELFGWTPGLPWAEVKALSGSGLDFVFSSLPWWDFRSDWFWEEAAMLDGIAPTIAPLEDPFGKPLAASIGDIGLLGNAQKRLVNFAAATGQGLMMPMGFESGATRPWDARRGHDLPRETLPDLAAALRQVTAIPGNGTTLRIGSPTGDVFSFVRSEADLRFAEEAELMLFNPSLRRRVTAPIENAMTALSGRFLPGTAMAQSLSLEPGALKTLLLRRHKTEAKPAPALTETVKKAADLSQRVAIEAVAPSVDDGRFPVKRLAGEIVTVTADILCDGHDQLSAALHWRKTGDASWQQARLNLINNDRWQAPFFLAEIGVYEFFVEAWRDQFASYRDELGKKHRAGVDVTVELMEGRHLLAAAGAPLGQALARFDLASQEDRIALLLSAEIAQQMMDIDPRPFATRSGIHSIDADRLESRFASWYEIFPRSMSDDPARHGTFRDVEKHLPRIRDMGFNVLYFPPIHPIGHSNRKGPNNTLTPGPHDPGSPYAVGNETGGHDAIHAELGTLEDFLHMREAAAAHGLEIALDFAIQCAPDHPWLKQHPGWFDWRPDGSIKYAENPPKKYQDIVNVDFYARDAIPGLWVALAEVVLFWCEQGVRIFRVDNPHTKPFPFWEWMIAQVKARFPDTLFLAEAFTRPKIMNRLGKIGFSQSYTYFTWRNTRAELEDYLTTLTTGPEADFFRPNFFVNTPDINPVFLQTSGRPGHLIRAALAATLAGLWGVYSGFELCEATPLPGREEYLDSEKYQIRAWDWQRTGNIVAEITLLNRLRQQNPALQSHLGLRFLPSDNDQVMIYEKSNADRSNVVIVAVSLDPAKPQSANTIIPFYAWRVPDNGALTVTDLVPGRRRTWQGKWQSVSLDPSFPFALWRVEPEIT